MPQQGQSKTSWLRLEISGIAGPPKTGAKNLLFSIPKQAVKKAVFRNRLRRLIREAVRKDLFFSDKEKIYRFKVSAMPDGINLERTKQKISEIKAFYQS